MRPRTSSEHISESNKMNLKKEMSSREELEEEFTSDIRPTQSTSIYHLISDIEIKQEEVDFHINSTADADPDTDTDNNCETLSRSISHVDCSSVKAEEKNLDEFYLDLQHCQQDCETCQMYLRILSEHVNSAHVLYQPTHDDPPHILSSPHVDCNSLKKDLNKICLDLLKCQRDCVTCQIHTRILSEHVISTHDPSQPSQPIQDPLHIDPSSVDPDPLQPHQSCSIQMKCEVDERSTHPPTHDPLHFDPDPPHSDHSSSIPFSVKCEVDENTDNMDHSQDVARLNSESDSEFKLESECVSDTDSDYTATASSSKRLDPKDPDLESQSESDTHPDYNASSHKTQNVRRRNLTKKNASRVSKTSKAKKSILQSRHQYKCNKCDRTYSTKRHLKEHTRIHNVEKSFLCDVCLKSLKTSSDLTRHKRIHTGEKPYTCDVCEKNFTRSSYLTVHKRIHTGERPFKCDVCGKRFVREHDLTGHKRVHTGEKPYKCTVCVKSFALNSTLNAHMKTHK